MYMKLKDGKSKVLTLSYDDGVVQDIRLIEILNKYGIKATFNINTGLYLLFMENQSAVQYAKIDADGKLRLDKAGLVAYAHGTYFELGKKIGTFGFSVAKKKKKPQQKKK